MPLKLRPSHSWQALNCFGVEKTWDPENSIDQVYWALLLSVLLVYPLKVCPCSVYLRRPFSADQMLFLYHLCDIVLLILPGHEEVYIPAIVNFDAGHCSQGALPRSLAELPVT